MHFKPRIFLSSTLDLSQIRDRIYSFFEEVGAEPLLYERNLTPSVSQATYRKDIRRSDFVIFIFEERYGSETESGLSGTHEEWIIANQNNIPSHVYIKRDSSSQKKEQLKEFISSEIDSNLISYYFYKDEKDLLNRLKQTTFSLAYNIVLSGIDNSHLDKNVVRRLSINHDYQEALPFLRILEEVIHLHQLDNVIDLERTTVLNFIFMIWGSYSDSNRDIFIDEKLNQLFSKIFTCFKDLNEYQIKNFTVAKNRSFYSKSLGEEVEYEFLSPVNNSVNIDWEWIRNKLKETIDAYEAFKKEVLAQKNKNELHHNFT